jgi:hypothetical protein
MMNVFLAGLWPAFSALRAGASMKKPLDDDQIDLDDSSMGSNDTSQMDMPSLSEGSSDSLSHALPIRVDDEMPTEHDDQDSAKAGMGSLSSSPISLAPPAAPPVVVPSPV